jgi:hypothetical protein
MYSFYYKLLISEEHEHLGWRNICNVFVIWESTKGGKEEKIFWVHNIIKK